ncbi:hypothetical protein P8452_42635 [Trifolium repens]|nr:hypothetical protein P8452_42635 [Trifolium repens]
MWLTAQWDPLTNPALSQNLLLNRSSCDSLALTESAVSRWVCDSLLRKNGGSCGLYKGLVGYECKKLKDRWKTIWSPTIKQGSFDPMTCSSELCGLVAGAGLGGL